MGKLCSWVSRACVCECICVDRHVRAPRVFLRTRFVSLCCGRAASCLYRSTRLAHPRCRSWNICLASVREAEISRQVIGDVKRRNLQGPNPYCQMAARIAKALCYFPHTTGVSLYRFTRLAQPHARRLVFLLLCAWMRPRLILG